VTGMSAPKRVAIVDDSPFICTLLSSYIESADDLRVVGTTSDPTRALDLILRSGPDVVLLDLDMPGLSGIDILARLMVELPLPVVMISGISRDAAGAVRRALELGAVDFIFKVSTDPAPAGLRRDIVARVRAALRANTEPVDGMACSTEVHAGPETSTIGTGRVTPIPGGEAQPSRSLRRKTPDQVAVIGASTGGPAALQELLGELPADFPAAIVVVQHLPDGFSAALASWLVRSLPLRVREACDGDKLGAGGVFIAPGDQHLKLEPTGVIHLNREPEVHGHRPSVTYTMRSALHAYGVNCHAVLLSGMGADGSDALVAVHDLGGATYVQDPASCVVSGMPERAIEAGAVEFIAPPRTLGRLLLAECTAQPVLEVVQ